MICLLALIICLFPGGPSKSITLNPTLFKVLLTMPLAQYVTKNHFFQVAETFC